MSTEPHDPTMGLTRIIIQPQEPEYPIEPGADAPATAPDGLPLPAVLWRGRVVAGAPLYRLCRARNHPCPAVELDPGLEPAEAVARVLDLVESLGPDPRIVLVAIRCKACDGDMHSLGGPLYIDQATMMVGVTYQEFFHALVAVAAPMRIGRLWLSQALD